MAPEWFLKGIITSLIINFMSNCGEAKIKERPENSKYLDGLNISRTSKDEKAFQMVKERIQEVLKKEEGRIFQSPQEEGTRKRYYKKYMKLGKTIDESMDYDNKETQHLSKQNFNKSNGNIVNNSEKESRDFQQLSAIGKKDKNDMTDKLNDYSKRGKWKKIGAEPNILSGRINNNDKYSKENYSYTNNILANTSSYLKNAGNYSTHILNQTNRSNTLGMNDNYNWINNYLDQIKYQKNKYLEKPVLKEKNQITYYKNIDGNKVTNEHLNTSINSLLQASRSLKGSHCKKKRKCYRLDKKISENKIAEETSKFKLKDHRRVRSCDIKMEDLRESFIPNEQLSIYHPKMSLSDQFILQDTMF